MLETTKADFKITMTIIFALFSILCVCMMFVGVTGVEPGKGMKIFLGFQSGLYLICSMIIYFNKNNE